MNKLMMLSGYSGRPTMIDELVYKYTLEGLVVGEMTCVRVWRSPITHRILATCELPSKRRLVMPAAELFAALTLRREGKRAPSMAPLPEAA